MKKCNRCDIEYENDKNFCKKCGSKLVVIDPKYARIKEGKLIFEEKLKNDPFNIEILFDYAKFLIDNSGSKEAISILYRILNIDENNNSAKQLLFGIFLEINEYEDALRTGNELLLSSPNNITLLSNLVETSNKLKDNENKLIYLNKILQLESTNISAITEKALTLLELNYILEAISVYNKLYDLGVKDVLTYSYAGIHKAINSEYKLSIELLKLGIKEYDKYNVHYFRAVLYLTYCLCETKVNISDIEPWLRKINFKVLKDNYFSLDEDIAIKTIYRIVKLKLDAIGEFSDKDYSIRECIETCLNETKSYFTEKSNSIIAECWYEIALKQSELSFFNDALDSCQKASSLIPSDTKYTDKEKEIQNHNICEARLKQKKMNLITVIGISFAIIITILSLILTSKTH